MPQEWHCIVILLVGGTGLSSGTGGTSEGVGSGGGDNPPRVVRYVSSWDKSLSAEVSIGGTPSTKDEVLLGEIVVGSGGAGGASPLSGMGAGGDWKGFSIALTPGNNAGWAERSGAVIWVGVNAPIIP